MTELIACSPNVTRGSQRFGFGATIMRTASASQHNRRAVLSAGPAHIASVEITWVKSGVLTPCAAAEGNADLCAIG